MPKIKWQPVLFGNINTIISEKRTHQAKRIETELTDRERIRTLCMKCSCHTCFMYEEG